MDKKEKDKLLKEAVDKINKECGEHTVMTLGEKAATSEDVISTGSLGLDEALGVWGLPKGRVIEIYGPESSGKTTLAIHVIAEAQKKGYNCAFIDVEHAFDKEYAANLGVDVDNLLISQPDDAEQALQVSDTLVKSGGIDVVVLDSISALVPKKERDGEVGDSTIGLQARLMGQALRKLTPNVSKNKVLFIFINQLREKIGVMFGSPEITSGGNALKFYASIRLDVRRSMSADNMVKEGKENIGNLTKVKVIKNKVAAPFKSCEFNIIWGLGIDKVNELIEMASNKGVIKKWGSSIKFVNNNEELKYNLDEFRQLLIDNDEMYKYLITKIKESSDK